MDNLARRVVTALVAAPIAIGAIWMGGLPLALFLGLAGGIGAWELSRFSPATLGRPVAHAGVLLAAATPMLVHFVHGAALGVPTALATVLLLCLAGVALFTQGATEHPLEGMALTVFGVFYAAGTLTFGYALRHHRFVLTNAGGTMIVLFPLLITWASDSGAYFIGRALGKGKLMPAVSPGKTVAGAVGAVVVSMAVSWGIARSLLPRYASLTLAPVTALVVGGVLSVIAQIGDLVESLMKRGSGVKDSSNILPGHGGVLDRLDSLYFVLPASYLLLERLLVPKP